jgi:phosphoribosyl-ATP pyrophosphohydrolase/phosphoribosyl-AMP cyclohydrolase
MKIDFKKGDGLVPAIIQDFASGKVMMLGYMNQEALDKSRQDGKVTFFSRSKNRLWTKGETSGNFLLVKEILLDCDGDTLLIKAQAVGPICHTGSATCFGEEPSKGFLHTLEEVIRERQADPQESSYTAALFRKGINKVAQKVGEEAVELVIEAKDDNKTLFLNEAADLLYHLMVLFRFKNIDLEEVESVLKGRHQAT